MAKSEEGLKSAARTLNRRGVLSAAAPSLVIAGLAAKDAMAGPRRRSGDILDVVVVGAGLAGLVAANDLMRAGMTNFIVLEARGRVGGRTINLPIGDGYITEGGGQWVGPGQTAVLELAQELDVGTFPFYSEGKTVLLASGAPIRLPPSSSFVRPELAAELDALARQVPLDAPWKAPRAAEWDATTFGAWLKARHISAADLFFVETSAMLTFGDIPEKVSLLWALFYIHSAGGYEKLESMKGGAQQDRIVGGSQMLSLKLAERLKGKVVLNAPVAAIRDWDRGSEATVVTVGDKTYRTRHVILAVPPSMAAGIRFDPDLPPMRAKLQAGWPADAGGAKVALVYPSPFWRAKGLSGLAMADDRRFLMSVDNSPPDGRKGVLMAFVNWPGSADDRRKMITAAMVNCFGPEAARPIAYVEQDWTGEVWNRGCVSPLPPGLLTTDGPALRAGFGRVILAGTETATIWNGYMDGAVRSGKHAAKLEPRMALEAMDLSPQRGS